MRLVANDPQFPFSPEVRAAPVVDLMALVVVAALVSHHVGSALAPPSTPVAAAAATPISRQVVLTIHPSGRWTLDGQLVPPAELEHELERRFADRPIRTLFIRPAAEGSWGALQDVVRRARATGMTVGVLPS